MTGNGRGTTAPATAARPDSRFLPQVRGHITGLDGIRAIAALMVLVFHVGIETGAALHPGVFGAFLSGGQYGVPLFFALSGLLLYRPWARAALDGTPRPAVLPYLWRRALRVLPAYWIVAATALLIWSDDRLGSVGAWVEVMTLTFTYDLDPWWVGTGPYGLGQMWSLCVEVSYYLLLPVIAYLLARYAGRAGQGRGRGGRGAANTGDGPTASIVDVRAKRLLIGLAVMVVLSLLAFFPQFYPEPRPYMHSWLPRTLGMFAVGMGLAVVSEWAWRESGPDGPVRRFCRTLPRAATLCWSLAAIVYILACTPAAGPRFVGVDGLWVGWFNSIISMAFAFFLIAPVALMPRYDAASESTGDGGSPLSRWSEGAWLRRLLAHPVSVYLGKISYGIFLWQFVVLYMWRGFTGQEIFTGSFWFDIVPVTLGTILCAAATYRWVEEPSRRWYNAVGPGRGKRKAKAEQTAATG
ncbi:acyltransferase [Nocardiopsis gilva YIM 90087]|uniref:Acyltransferase n=1 Tax=Nocardiopsis gilva YIM 90087 TaxID=1235441 RepID=A0A223SBF6_9ACTN|nr:acyltransferase [Nocardiopsis gilva YIM 90087]